MGTMFACSQDHSINRVFVKFQQTCSGSYANTLCCMVDNLPDHFSLQVQAKQGACLGRGKTLATGPTVKQNAVLVLAILAANGDVTLMAQAVILALFVGTEKLLKFAHRLPPA